MTDDADDVVPEEIVREYRAVSALVESTPLHTEITVPKDLIDQTRDLYALLEGVPDSENPAADRSWEEFLVDTVLSQVHVTLKYPDGTMIEPSQPPNRDE